MEPLDPKRYTVTHTWTQPYLPTSYNPFYQSVQSRELELELDRLDALDLLVDQMTEYPDAQRLLEKLK